MRVDALRLVGAAGTNRVMAGELSRLSRRAFTDFRLSTPAKRGKGALLYPFDPRLALLAVHYHRTSARVLWDLAESRATRLEPLYEELVATLSKDERPWLNGARKLSVQTFNVGEFAAGERQLLGTVKNAIVEAARVRGVALSVDSEQPDRVFSVRLFEGLLTVSLDLAGRPMNQRGYREFAGDAPLREDLAAVLVMLSRFNARSELLIDPMAGSGSLAIEAACMARATPGWVGREPSCERWPVFEGIERQQGPLFADTRAAVWANDILPEAAAGTRQNLERAGCAEGTVVTQGDFRAIERTKVLPWAKDLGLSGESGVILCNPPYGERLKPRELAKLYRDLGVWARRFTGFRAAFLVANTDFESQFGGEPRIKKPLNNGPLRGMFYMYDL